jgi:hypothetical protein
LDHMAYSQTFEALCDLLRVSKTIVSLTSVSLTDMNFKRNHCQTDLNVEFTYAFVTVHQIH